ncbi:MAG: hypothetical protein D5R97_03920 [Candidatus Syntrophonatronum acetioxidans]|uniref:Stage II sporulation protein R n=1 Tax=Candidatus Syntrophonatronum acetioxidans TaxID=1795816 RepID=A0A424YFW2_9FIRM|nr:MAG: hypothetical protein D5R97_03920 [Candidatus Syntrophonatronum acetioxidans]
MKKTKIRLLLFIILILSLMVTLSAPLSSRSYFKEEGACPAREVIRFHVRAHSNHPREQEVKNRVTREILSEMGPLLEGEEVSQKAREKIEEKIPALEELARRVLQEEGLTHSVEARLENHSFPSRQYPYGYFPAGEYEALRVIIGEGAGENWWCVLFPPLCFIHPPAEEIKEGEEIQVRFRLVQVVENLFPVAYQAEKGDKKEK